MLIINAVKITWNPLDLYAGFNPFAKIRKNLILFLAAGRSPGTPVKISFSTIAGFFAVYLNISINHSNQK